MSFFFEPFNALESEFQFVLVNPFFDVVLSVTQHAVDQSCQMVGHGHDCLWGAKSGSQAPVLGSQRAFTVGQTLSAKPQGVGSTIVNLARRAAYNLASGDQIVRAQTQKGTELLFSIPSGHVQTYLRNDDLGSLLFNAWDFGKIDSTDPVQLSLQILL